MLKKVIRKVSLTETVYALENGLPLYIKHGDNWCPYNFGEGDTIADLIRELNHETFGLERTK